MSSLTRRRDLLAARRTEPKPYPERVDVREIKGRDAARPPSSGWGRPRDRHAHSGYRKLLVTRPFGKGEQPYLTGAFVNLVRRPNRVDDAIQLPPAGVNRSQPRNRPSMDEGLC